jgi:GTPase SAR1 family protein
MVDKSKKCQDPWKRLKDTFDITAHDIQESVKAIKQAAAMSQQSNRGNGSAMALLDDVPESRLLEGPGHAALHYAAALMELQVLQPGRRRRQDRKPFQRSSQSFRPIALYGMAGVGKTHVAIKYAQSQFKQRKVSAVFCVEAESKMKAKQSSTDIAARLQLPGYVPHNHEDNRLLVLIWLQNTSSGPRLFTSVGLKLRQPVNYTEAKWLIVYDSVESFDVLDAHWPSPAASGHALITTRNTDLAYEPADAGIEVEPWDTQTVSQFLLHLLSGHISADLPANQAKSALELSESLSGHALALARMGGVMHRRCWTIKQLVEVYDQAPEFGQNGIGPVWQLSFQNLSPRGSSLLSVISFCSADTARHPRVCWSPGIPKASPKNFPGVPMW